MNAIRRLFATICSRATAVLAVAMASISAQTVEVIWASGAPDKRRDIVFLGDGFTAAEMPKYKRRVARAVGYLVQVHPFKAIRSTFNIHRVDVVSNQSGTDFPYPPPGVSVDTALDTGFDANSVISGDLAKINAMGSLAPGFDVAVVLINQELIPGGAAVPPYVYVDIGPGFERRFVHELGHALGFLDDEYNFLNVGPVLPAHNTPVGTGYSGAGPNVTITTVRDELDWHWLVLPTTALPTQRQQPNCSEVAIAPSPVARDIVGAFEGGGTYRCHVYRPEYNCMMRHHGQQFCAVCRRALIQRLRGHYTGGHAVFFSELEIRNDHDAWGAGEIYVGYTLVKGTEVLRGVWPRGIRYAQFHDGEVQSTDFFAGVVSDWDGATTIRARVRERDWWSAEVVESDAEIAVTGPGPFEIDGGEYRLEGEVRKTDIAVLLDTLHIKDARDDGAAGEVYVDVYVENGARTVRGRWPIVGTVSMQDMETRHVAVLAAAIEKPAAGESLVVSVFVRDADSGPDDEIGTGEVGFDAAAEYGAKRGVHVIDDPGFRLTYAIIKGL